MTASTNATFFDEYLAAWNAHDPAAVARHMADDAIYEDVALGRVLHGRSEIAAFVEEATRASSDFRFEEVSLFTAGSGYATEWVMTGTNDREEPGVPATGRSFRVRGASVGKLDPGGQIVANRDYYNRARCSANLASSRPLGRSLHEHVHRRDAVARYRTVEPVPSTCSKSERRQDHVRRGGEGPAERLLDDGEEIVSSSSGLCFRQPG